MTGADARDAARWVAEETRSTGGRLRVFGSTLLQLFLAERFDESACQAMEQALGTVGLSWSPKLTPATVSPATEVEFRQVSFRSPDDADDDGEPDAAPPAPPRTPRPQPAQVLAGRAAALPSTAVSAGVLVPGVVVTALGFAGYWLYGLVFLAVTA